MNDIHNHIQSLEKQILKLEEEKLTLLGKLQQSYAKLKNLSNKPTPLLKSYLSTDEKIRIFMNLFKGRSDVFPKR